MNTSNVLLLLVAICLVPLGGTLAALDSALASRRWKARDEIE